MMEPIFYLNVLKMQQMKLILATYLLHEKRIFVLKKMDQYHKFVTTNMVAFVRLVQAIITEAIHYSFLF